MALNTNYVKFLRGTPAAYASLSSPDSDTLYFISNPDEATGKLYLGNQLLSNGINSINDLDGLDLTSLADGSILVYNEDKGTWVSQNVSEVIKIPIMVGATTTEDSVPGLVPVAAAGELGKFLRSDGTWATVSTADSFNLSEVIDHNVLTLNSDGDITLKEVPASLIPVGEGNLNTVLLGDGTEDNIGLIAEVAQLKQQSPGTIDLSAYVTKSAFNAVIGTDINNYTRENTVIEDIDTLYEILTWKTLNEEGGTN